MIFAGIMAGGSGKRFGGDIPKQFLPLCGRPVILYSIDAFFSAAKALDEEMRITVILPYGYGDEFNGILLEYYPKDIRDRISLTAGGETRHQSICRLCDFVKATLPGDGDIIITHDAARPIVTADLIIRCITAARRGGGATACTPVTDTVLRANSKGHASQIVDRQGLYRGQTPQAFLARPFIMLVDEAGDNAGFTDAAGIYINAGRGVSIVESGPENIKITTPEDIMLAEAFLAQ